MTEVNRLQAIGLTKRYGGFTALNNVALSLAPGEIRGLIGSNGAGKSTCMDLLSGRGKHLIGDVFLDGRKLNGLSERARRNVGMARSFQKTNIFMDMTVADQVALAARAVNADNAKEVLESLNLVQYASMRAADISYGDQRRVDLALSLVGKPKLLLLDEPAAGLTAAESLSLAETLREVADKWRLTVLLVEHDMEVVFSICRWITVLHLGEVLAEGTPENIRRNKKVAVAYLGSSAE